MPLITACPACQTQFEVTDEQLQAYAGKVRCGECDHVFDARSYLLEPHSAASTDSGTTEPATDASLYFKLSAAVAHAAEPPSAVPDLPLPDPLPAELPVHHPEASDHAANIPAFLRDISLADERPTAPETQANQRMMVFFASILLLVLLLQSMYFMRSSLAAHYPQTKPLFQRFCETLHCVVNMPQDIAQLTIDDADIQEHKTRQGVLTFSSVLMNHGPVAQAYPKIELTLTNMADEPVLRKTLRPAEYLPASANLAAGLLPQQEQAVKTLLGVDEKLVTGFRVAIAY